MKKEALIVGGSNGIGLSIAMNLPTYDCIHIIDKQTPELLPPNAVYHAFDLLNDDYSIFNNFQNIDTLIITAGFGKLALFQDLDEDYITKSFKVNTIGVIRILKHFYPFLLEKKDFYCAVMVSIAGYLSSPFFSIYGATKAALSKFIESVNVELIKSGSPNCILNISPGAIKGTKFNNNNHNDLDLNKQLACNIIHHIYNKDDLYIPEYEEIFENVLKRYHNDFRKFGLESYDYKLKRINSK